MPRRSARFAGLLASVLLISGTAAACGGSGSDSATTDKAAAENSAYPVTIAHKYGSATVKSEPERIVTVGLTDQDAVLALGKAPVATTHWLGDYAGDIGPWAKTKLGKAAAPTVLKDSGSGPQFEKIAALKPDLIIALYSGLTKEQHTTLSKIAPVIAQPKQYNDYGIPWQQTTLTVGKALGKSAQAQKLVDGVNAKFAAARKAHPEFSNASGVMATPYQGYFVYGSEDSRSRLLTSLGFKLPANLDKVIGDTFGANISKERVDLLDKDATVWIVGDTTKDPAKLHMDSLYGGLKVAKQGREVFIKETSDYGNATSTNTVLSIPYVLDRLVPQLAAAVDGTTATKVEQPAP